MQELFKLFEEMGYEHFRQGSLADEDYLDSFFTYWNYDSPTLKNRDNVSKVFGEYVMVYFYTNNANLIYSVMDDFITRAKQKGFIVEGKAHDTPADKDDYFGRLVNIKIISKEDE